MTHSYDSNIAAAEL